MNSSSHPTDGHRHGSAPPGYSIVTPTALPSTAPALLTETWEIAAFLDTIGHSAVRPSPTTSTPPAIATAAPADLEVGIAVTARVVGARIPAPLTSVTDQYRYLVTALVIHHYAEDGIPLAAERLRARLRTAQYDPTEVWAAADAYLSAYRWAESWTQAQRLGPRALRLPALTAPRWRRWS